MPAPARAQAARAVRPTPVHKEPGGTLLARLTTTVNLPVTATRQAWRQVRLDGWIATSLVKRDGRDGYDISVAGSDVRLRSAPNGKALALLEEGMLLKRLGSQGKWTHVQRDVWVPAARVADAVVSKPAPEAPQAYQARPSGGPVSTSSVTPPGPGAADDGQRMAVVRNTAIMTTPDSGQAGTINPGTQLRVVGTAGEWSRVELQGWVRTADVAPATGAAVGVTAAEVRANPERFVGKDVEWKVQYISTASADELRPEMPPGQPYMLARGPLPEPGFVYVMMSRDDSSRVANLPALSELTIRAKVRAARTRFLATPVVELESILSPELPH